MYKASVYAKMVIKDGELVAYRASGNYTVIAKVGACCSLIKTEIVYPSANSRYRYNEHISCCGVLLGITRFNKICVDGGAYTYYESVPYITDLVVGGAA